MRRILSAIALAFLTAATAAAEGDVPSTPFILHPMAASSPALKYALLPEVRDSIPGDAVPHYRQAIKNKKRDAPPEVDWHPAIDQWLAMPLKNLPREEVGRFLKQCETTFEEAEAGARCEQCDWGLTEELRKKGISTLLPDLQDMREIAVLLALRTRYELAEGKPDEAVRSLRTGFAMSHHVAEQPTLISDLVAAAIAAIMEARLEDFIQQPGAPNFYWPLTDLPRPLIDMRKGMQGERVGTYGTFPGAAETAADLNAKPWTPEQTEKAMAQLALVFEEQDPLLRLRDKAEVALRIAYRHEAAKTTLIGQGRPRELVEAMPHMQVALLVALQQYDQLYDEILKLDTLPYPEWQPRTAEAEKRLKQVEQTDDGPAIPLARLLLPAVTKVHAAQTRIDRRIAALRCVEAIRLYAADHDGKFPPSLDAIEEVPIPTDPVTGKPFDYHPAGDRAFFSSAPFAAPIANKTNTPTYELIIQR